MKAIIPALVVLMATVAAPSLSRAAPETGVGRIPTLTRLVQVFSQLETQLAEAGAQR